MERLGGFLPLKAKKIDKIVKNFLQTKRGG